MEKKIEPPKVLWGIGSEFKGLWPDLLSQETPLSTINRVIIGFHGYGERAETQVRRFDKICLRETDLWLCPQAFHGFLIQNRQFREIPDSEKWGWSWMGSSHRAEHISLNKQFTETLKSVMAQLGLGEVETILLGHSQGASHAWRVASWWSVHQLILHAGDIPPELRKQWPSTLKRSGFKVLLARSLEDDIYTEELMARDCKVLEQMGSEFQTWEGEGSHHWGGSWSRYLRGYLSPLGYN